MASMRVPTMRMRTSAPACTRTASSALTNAGSSADTKSKSSGMRWLDTNSCSGPASAKKPTCAARRVDYRTARRYMPFYLTPVY